MTFCTSLPYYRWQHLFCSKDSLTDGQRFLKVLNRDMVVTLGIKYAGHAILHLPCKGGPPEVPVAQYSQSMFICFVMPAKGIKHQRKFCTKVCKACIHTQILTNITARGGA
eukprot:m.315817 g.315817  ORF g.315817 m.315817 type:complete len:111 (+) comp15975_c1_seq14:531-863(+)